MATDPKSFWDAPVEIQRQVLDPYATTPPPYSAEGGLYPGNNWDKVSIGGMGVPGLCTVATKAGRRVQKKKNNGDDGEIPTFRGYEAATVDIGVRIWTIAQFDALTQVIAKIFPAANKSAEQTALVTAALAGPGALSVALLDLSAFSILHPSLGPLGITNVIVTDVSNLTPDSVKGAMACTIKCRQWVPHVPKNRTKTIDHAKSVPPSATVSAFQASKNNPPPPSQTDFGPQASFQPAGGSS